MNIVYNGIVKESGVHIYNRKAFDKECQSFIGKNVQVTVKLKRKSRSLMQNAYYWGVVVPIVKQGLFDIGYKVSKEQAHELLKTKFHIIEIVNENTGEIMKSIGSTTDMTTTTMMDYIASIQQWAAEYLGVTIPDPEQQIEIEL